MIERVITVTRKTELRNLWNGSAPFHRHGSTSNMPVTISPAIQAAHDTYMFALAEIRKHGARRRSKHHTIGREFVPRYGFEPRRPDRHRRPGRAGLQHGEISRRPAAIGSQPESGAL